MKAKSIYSLRGSIGDYEFHRKKGKHNIPGVYFWGFNLREDNQNPKSGEDILIWYIGKDKNVTQRIMQEVAQLIFGGFGTIIDHNYLKSNPCSAHLHDLQESDNKRTKPIHSAVLYKSDGLHVLYHFFEDKKILETIQWMRERLIFTWIEEHNAKNRTFIEQEMHRIVGTNIYGIGAVNKLKTILNIGDPSETPYFNKVDWSENEPLKDWLTKVNEKVLKK